MVHGILVVEFPKCSIDGCEKRTRSLKGGYCQMHYTRERAHGDVNVNLYEGRGQEWELPDGTIIREAKKIKNLNIIIERIKNKRLLGYQKNNDDTLDIIEKVLDDYHGKYKSGKVKRGKKTLLYATHVDVLANSNLGFEQGLITIKQANLISKVVSELSKSNTPIKFWDVCKTIETSPDEHDWLLKAFTKHPIIGITYDSKEKTIAFSQDISWFYDESDKITEHTANDGIAIGLHFERFASFKQHDDFKSEQYPYSVLVSTAVQCVIKYLIKNRDTEENTLYEKCHANQIMLQQMIENNIGIVNDNGIVKFTVIPKIQELIKKEKQMWDDHAGDNLTQKEILSILGINYVEESALRTIMESDILI